MCLILFGYKICDQYDLVLAANRDEFYVRPTAPMHFWKKPVDLLAGKDLDRGGTWLGINRKGKFAALTNFRDPKGVIPSANSRGHIVTDFLKSDQSPDQFRKKLEQAVEAFSGFNLLFGTPEKLNWFSNVHRKFCTVEPGFHGLSNGYLNTPWPKVEKGRTMLEKAVNGSFSHKSLLEMLKDSKQPPDDLLPDTGVGIEWERLLSSLFIQSDVYGTRSSTVVTIDKSGRIRVTERTYSIKKTDFFEDRKFEFQSNER